MTHTERLTSEVNRLGAQLAAVTRQLGEADTRVVNAEIRAEEHAAALERLARELGREGITPDDLVDEVLEKIKPALREFHTGGESGGRGALDDAARGDRPEPDILPDPRIAELQR
jgi:hypothetical protein